MDNEPVRIHANLLGVRHTVRVFSTPHVRAGAIAIARVSYPGLQNSLVTPCKKITRYLLRNSLVIGCNKSLLWQKIIRYSLKQSQVNKVR